jgi:hypothetical protein
MQTSHYFNKEGKMPTLKFLYRAELILIKHCEQKKQFYEQKPYCLKQK